MLIVLILGIIISFYFGTDVIREERGTCRVMHGPLMILGFAFGSFIGLAIAFGLGYWVFPTKTSDLCETYTVQHSQKIYFEVARGTRFVYTDSNNTVLSLDLKNASIRFVKANKDNVGKLERRVISLPSDAWYLLGIMFPENT